MSSLSDLPEVVGFFSYSREDDDAFKGSLSALRDGIQRELSAQLGRTKRNFRLWQDQEGIAPGRLWESEIKAAVDQAVFFIPIVTPRAVNSENCQIEYGAFLDRERELGRTDLVFPILYIGVPALENEVQWRNHPVLSVVAKRQYVDWRQFRHHDIHTTAVREAIERFCGKIVEALNRQWLSAEERQRLQAAEEQARRSKDEAEAQRIAEERRRAEAEAEAERRVQDEKARSQAEAEAQRRAGEEAQRMRDEVEAQRIAEDNPRQQAEAQRIAEEQGQQQANAERLAQEEKDRIRAAEAARLVEEETRKRKAASEAAAPAEKKAHGRMFAVGAALIAVVAVAIWFVNRAPSNNSATTSQSCYQTIEASAAVAACTQAITLNPKDVSAYSNRCSAYNQLGNYSAALADCNQAIAIDPKDKLAYSNRCSAYINQGNHSAALADCNQAIAIDPSFGFAYSNRCAAYSGLGQYRAGLADCNQAIAFDPKDGNAYFNRAVIYEHLGENAEAIADYQKTLTINPSDPDAQNELKRLGASPAAPGGR